MLFLIYSIAIGRSVVFPIFFDIFRSYLSFLAEYQQAVIRLNQTSSHIFEQKTDINIRPIHDSVPHVNATKRNLTMQRKAKTVRKWSDFSANLTFGFYVTRYY